MSNQEDSQLLSDKELIGIIKAGDMDAMGELMGRYTSKAYQIAYSILGNKDDAEEVTQDAFVRIYRALSSFRGDSEFSTWMYRIVVNQARNKYRWNKRRGSHLTVSVDRETKTNDGSTRSFDLADTGKTPDNEVIFREWEGEIAEEIKKLPEVNREALLLRNVKNLSYEQIASLLNCKVGTIKSRISRAREELRRKVSRHPYEQR